MSGSAFKVSPYEKEGVSDVPCNQFAFLHSSSFKKIFDCKQKSCKRTNQIEGYLKVIHGKRKVYLKFRSLNTVTADQVQLSYPSRCALDVVTGKNEAPKGVQIKKSSWFSYYWRNGDAGIRMPFHIAVIGIIIALLSFVLSILQFFNIHF